MILGGPINSAFARDGEIGSAAATLLLRGEVFKRFPLLMPRGTLCSVQCRSTRYTYHFMPWNKVCPLICTEYPDYSAHAQMQLPSLAALASIR